MLARRAVDDVDLLGERTRADLELLLSEVVTNVVRHSGLGPGNDMTVGMRIERGRVRAEVTDGAAGSIPRSPVRAPEPGAESGYGLFLLDRLAARWGVRRGPPATVWFELDG
jgi:anti-sigma regulatory factor (Ser/Thr protein kinase)